MSALVSFNRVSLGYGHRTVLSDLTFAIPEGDFLGLVGPNGAERPHCPRLPGSAAGRHHHAPAWLRWLCQSDRVEYGFRYR
jgi:hypothetical protein